MTTMTRETMEARKANGAGPLICGDCSEEINLGEHYQWSGRTTGNAYSHIACQGDNSQRRAARTVRSWEKSEWS